MPIIAAIPDEEQQLMRKEARQTRDKNHTRRLIAMLILHQRMTVSEVARLLCAARSSVGRWINWFTLQGIEGLKSLKPGRARRWPVAYILAHPAIVGTTFSTQFWLAAFPLEH